MARDEASWALKLAPIVGSVVVTLGLVQSGLAVLGGELKTRLIGTGLLMAGGGTMLIRRRTAGRPRFWIYLLGSGIAATVIIAWLRAVA